MMEWQLEEPIMKKLWLLGMLVLTLVYPGQAQNQHSELVTTLEVFLSQLELTIQQASLSVFSPNLNEAKKQANTALNIAVGQTDASFDSTVPNLGDGVGLTTYVRRLGRIFESNPELEPYKITWDNIRFFVSIATDQLKAALHQNNLDNARRLTRIAQGLLLAARGAPGDLPSEGGIRTLLGLVHD